MAVAAITCSAMLAGCGGADAPVTPATSAQSGTPSSPTGASPQTVGSTDATAGAASGDASGSTVERKVQMPGRKVTPGEPVTTHRATPQAFVSALGRKPIAVFFYQPGSSVDELFRRQVRAAVGRHKGLVYLEYRLSDFRSAGDLVEVLGMYDLPGIAVISRNGRLQNIKSIYWPAPLIDRSIARASAASPASVTPTDVPASEPTDRVETLVRGTARLSGTASG